MPWPAPPCLALLTMLWMCSRLSAPLLKDGLHKECPAFLFSRSVLNEFIAIEVPWCPQAHGLSEAFLMDLIPTHTGCYLWPTVQIQSSLSQAHVWFCQIPAWRKYFSSFPRPLVGEEMLSTLFSTLTWNYFPTGLQFLHASSFRPALFCSCPPQGFDSCCSFFPWLTPPSFLRDALLYFHIRSNPDSHCIENVHFCIIIQWKLSEVNLLANLHKNPSKFLGHLLRDNLDY